MLLRGTSIKTSSFFTCLFLVDHCTSHVWPLLPPMDFPFSYFVHCYGLCLHRYLNFPSSFILIFYFNTISGLLNYFQKKKKECYLFHHLSSIHIQTMQKFAGHAPADCLWVNCAFEFLGICCEHEGWLAKLRFVFTSLISLHCFLCPAGQSLSEFKEGPFPTSHHLDNFQFNIKNSIFFVSFLPYLLCFLWYLYKQCKKFAAGACTGRPFTS